MASKLPCSLTKLKIFKLQSKFSPSVFISNVNLFLCFQTMQLNCNQNAETLFRLNTELMIQLFFILCQSFLSFHESTKIYFIAILNNS